MAAASAAFARDRSDTPWASSLTVFVALEQDARSPAVSARMMLRIGMVTSQ
jgi:hypothetical protein